jgi:hypothetical protein
LFSCLGFATTLAADLFSGFARAAIAGSVIAARSACVETRHRSGHTTFVQENQAFLRPLDRRNTGIELFALFAIALSVLFGGVERLLLRRTFNFRKRREIWVRQREIRASFCNFSCTLTSVRSGCASNQAFTVACISIPTAGFRPGW